MTRELQQAMARYEETRAAYRVAVLSSLNGESSGEAIRLAIRSFQSARSELIRLGGLPAETPAKPPAKVESPAWRLVRRILPSAPFRWLQAS
jgi:hypothetical protein